MGAVWDTYKIGQIDVQELETPIRRGVSLLDLVNGLLCFLLRSTGEVDCAVLGVDDLGQLFATWKSKLATTRPLDGH